MRLLRGMLIGIGLGFLVSRFTKSKKDEPSAAPFREEEPDLKPDSGPTAKAGRVAYAIKEQFRYAWKEAAAEVDQREEELLQEFRNYHRQDSRQNQDSRQKKKRGLFRRG